MTKRRLFSPGPTEVPWQVSRQLAQPLIHHRTDEFRQIHRELVEGLQWLMRTENPVLVLTSSGTGAMEAAAVNLTGPGDKVLVTVLGKFSQRWKEIAEAYGLDVITVEATWGDPVPVEKVREALETNPDVSAVFTTHAETSTGVLQDVKAMAELAHNHGALIIVDGITSVGCEELETDEWGLDVVVGGAQKGVMTPPGLSYLAVSPAARERIEHREHPVYYFDLARALKSYKNWDTPWSPGIPLIIGMREALVMMRAEGRENILRRHARNSQATRAGVTALGLRVLASVPARCTTAVVIENNRAESVKKYLVKKHGFQIAGGQARLKGKIVRIGHLGYYYEADMVALMAAFESTLFDLEIIDSLGPGVEAMLEVYRGK
ncbi:MAG: alanine--glyoxylate aminotransferase family protein [Candidatus Latescibacterota bacterium]|nr:MAG: alanine--glyoxylate aminotransferase family protein [Candidatus Latescibacterota bacterium]